MYTVSNGKIYLNSIKHFGNFYPKNLFLILFHLLSLESFFLDLQFPQFAHLFLIADTKLNLFFHFLKNLLFLLLVAHLFHLILYHIFLVLFLVNSILFVHVLLIIFPLNFIYPRPQHVPGAGGNVCGYSSPQVNLCVFVSIHDEANCVIELPEL